MHGVVNVRSERRFPTNPQGLFTDTARECDLRCLIEDSTTPNLDNARFRYEVTLIKPTPIKP